MDTKRKIKLVELIDPQTGKKQPYILELKQVGRGFYGTVFKAVHRYNPSMVFAVKVIKLQNKQSIDQILKELAIIRQMPKSSNLVQIHKLHLQSQKNFYLFQEFCDGGSLAEFRQKHYNKLMREQEIYDMFFQLGKGYIDLYKSGIIHEDIKPSNILIKGKLFKYCDFGISQLAKNVKHSTTRRGTISYMPPQKLKNKFLPNPKSDIYSLGVTLYEVIFGFHPYLTTKTKNFKEYVATINKAHLKTSDQLKKYVYNPSIMFDNFINILEGMIALKVQLRVGIDQLIDILTNHQPYKSMHIPVQNQSPRTSPNSKGRNSYQESQNFQVVEQSKIIIRREDVSLQNRLKNETFEIDLAESQSDNIQKQIDEQLRLTKVRDEEENFLYLTVVGEHKILQEIVSYFNAGFKILKQVYQEVECKPFCRQTFFLTIEGLCDQKVCDVIQLMILRLNYLIITSFRELVQDFQRFYKETPLTQEIQYLQTELQKYIVDRNIVSQEMKKRLIQITQTWTIKEICNNLQAANSELFNSIVYQNSVRINFRNDILNGLYLKSVNKVLEGILKLNMDNENEENDLSSISGILKCPEIQKSNEIIKKFNIYRKMKIEELKEEFYQQFRDVEEIMYDFEQNSGEFVNLTDIIDDLQSGQMEAILQFEQENEVRSLTEADIDEIQSFSK